MNPILLLLMASAPLQPGARVTAFATAQILPGARIHLEKQEIVGARAADGQRNRIIRRTPGDPASSELRLVEFQ